MGLKSGFYVPQAVSARWEDPYRNRLFMEWELAVYPNVLILIWQERRRKEKKEKQKERS